ncbi:MAG: VOC family protein [Bacteroidia bacterium]
MISFVEIILYVEDQQRSTLFYKNLLKQEPSLNVPGMTEFNLNPQCKLGLMTNNGIAKILANKTPHPATGNGIPRCELYLYTDDIAAQYENTIACGAVLIDNISQRDWGDKVCYFADPDGHIIAFAQKIHS